MTEGTALLRAITALSAIYTNRPPNNVQEQLDRMSLAELRELGKHCDALRTEAGRIARAKRRQRGVYDHTPLDYRGMDETADCDPEDAAHEDGPCPRDPHATR